MAATITWMRSEIQRAYEEGLRQREAQGRINTLPSPPDRLPGGADSLAQAVSVTYGTFMQLNANERLERFQALTPANQADLLREHLVRWRRLHADRLTSEQNQILTEVAKYIRPEQFEPLRRRSNDEVNAFMSLEERISGAFTAEDSYNAFTLRGMYLAPR